MNIIKFEFIYLRFFQDACFLSAVSSTNLWVGERPFNCLCGDKILSKGVAELDNRKEIVEVRYDPLMSQWGGAPACAS